jgi:opacity protein-like surface antigen
MHRFLGRFVIGASALLFATRVHAQGTPAGESSGRPFKLGGMLGATVPIGDFGDGANVGFHAGGLIEYKPNALPFNLRGEITYNRNGLKEGFFGGDDPVFDNVDGNVSILNFVGNGVFPFGDPASTARPYAIGGVGVYRMKFSGEFGGLDVSDTQTKFGINIGGGFQFNLSGFETFVEARFHSVFAEGDKANFIPLTFGFKF